MEGFKMRYSQMPLAAVVPQDDPAMIEAITTLTAAGIDVRRPANSLHQLKVSPLISYYPGRQTIVADGEPTARPQRGLAALLIFLNASPDRSPRIQA